MTKKGIKFKLLCILGILGVIALLGWFLLTKENIEIIKSVFKQDMTTEEIQERLNGLGIRGYATISILSMMAVVFTFVPSEPIQVISGLAFGFIPGLIACLAGVLVGNTIIYVMYLIFGDKLNAYFDKELDLNLNKMSNSRLITFVILLLYVLPVVPYGMICFFAATMRLKFSKYTWVTLIGAIPSEAMGVILGHAAMASSWVLSASIFGVILVLLIIFVVKKDEVMAYLNKIIDKAREHFSDRFTVKQYKSRKLKLPYRISRILLAGKVKVKYIRKVKELDHPCVVLCNHGSFIDFAYAGAMLKEHSPNFVVARLYFFKRLYRNILRSFGCFPKSMFCADLESAKNCLQVLRRGGVLAMMPEARLSTVGKFEDIQEGTYSFLKKAAVTVYSIKMSGDFFAKPKWGDKIRKGSYVEAELDTLIEKDELLGMSVDEIKQRVEERLYYNEFDWLETHPEISYKSKTLAKGLENVLTLCPKCGERYSIYTKGMHVHCESCGMKATLDRRYSFINAQPFDNFASWYEWQTEEYKKEILSNPDFALRSKVELKNSDKRGKKSLIYAGKGECTLNRVGLTYVGTRNGEHVTKHFPMSEIYRLLFGAGEDFEIYEGREIFYFIPEDKRSCVDWYIVSKILKELEADAPACVEA